MGLVFSPILLAHAPLVLVAISPFLHHLVAVSALSNSYAFATVAIASSLFQAWIGYDFGLRMSSFEESWITKYTKWISRWGGTGANRFSVVAPILLFVVPGPIIGAVLGLLRVPKLVFGFALVASQVVWITLCFVVGQALTDRVEALHGFLLRYGIPVTLGLVALWALKTVIQQRKRKNQQRKPLPVDSSAPNELPVISSKRD